MIPNGAWRILPAITVVVTCSVAPAKDKKMPAGVLTAEFFPMRVGDKWTYAHGKTDVVFKVLKTEKAKERKLFVVQRTVGKSSVDFKLSIRKDGVYIHQEGTKQFTPPLRQFAFPARKGETWKWQGTYGDEKRIEQFEFVDVVKKTVSAGKFSAILVLQKNKETGDKVRFYLAKGVGVINLRGKTELIRPNHRKVLFDWRLKRFERSKK